MIKKYSKEYTKDGIAIKEVKIYFLGIKVKEELITTTNSNIVYQLTLREKKHNINGFINNK